MPKVHNAFDLFKTSKDLSHKYINIDLKTIWMVLKDLYQNPKVRPKFDHLYLHNSLTRYVIVMRIRTPFPRYE